MISYFFMTILIGLVAVITSPLQLLPTASLPSALTSSLATAGTYIRLFDIIVPVATLLQVIGIMISIEAAYFLYKGIRWIYNKIPGVT